MGPDDEIQSSPVWGGWDGEHFMFSLTRGRQKYENLVRNPTIAVSATDPDNPYRYLEIRGTVVRVDDDASNTFIDSMAKKYMGVDEYPMAPTGRPPRRDGRDADAHDQDGLRPEFARSSRSLAAVGVGRAQSIGDRCAGSGGGGVQSGPRSNSPSRRFPPGRARRAAPPPRLTRSYAQRPPSRRPACDVRRAGAEAGEIGVVHLRQVQVALSGERRCRSVDLLDVADQPAPLHELEPFEPGRFHQRVDHLDQIVDERLILGAVECEARLDVDQHGIEMARLVADDAVEAQPLPTGEVVFARGEQTERIREVGVDQLLGRVDAAADHAAGFDQAHPGTDEEAGAFEAADDVRVEVGDRGPVGLAHALAVGAVDHPERSVITRWWPSTSPT